MWSATPYIGSFFALVAFIAAAGAVVYRARARREEVSLKDAGDAARVEIVNSILGRFAVNTDKLTNTQRYHLALEQIRNQRRKTTVIAIVSIVLGAMLGTASILISKSQEPVAQPQSPTSSRQTPADGWAIWDEVAEADRLVNIAVDHYRANRPKETEANLSQALVIYKKAAALHPDRMRQSLGDTSYVLAGLYISQQRYTEAEELLLAALKQYQSLAADYVSNEIDVAQASNRLASIKISQGDWKHAEIRLREAREALKTFRFSFAFPFEQRPQYVAEIQYATENLALALSRQGKTDSAKEFTQELVKIRAGDL